MKKYENPRIEVIKIEAEDIIMVSGITPQSLNYGNGDSHDGVNLGSKSAEIFYID